MEKSSYDYDKLLQSLQDKRTCAEQLGQAREKASVDFLNKLREFQQTDNERVNVFSAYRDLERDNKELMQVNRNIIGQIECLEASCKRLTEDGSNIVTSTVHRLSMINNEMDNCCNLQDHLGTDHDPDNIRKEMILICEKVDEKKKVVSSFGTYEHQISRSEDESIPRLDEVLIFHESVEASNRKKLSNIIQNYDKLRDKLNRLE